VNDDFIDLLRALLTEDTRFLVVGAHALAVHGVPRATGDLDVWLETDPKNAARAWRGLSRFGAPVAALGVSEGDLCRPDTVIQIGVPPRRIDLMTTLSGLEFATAWAGRVMHVVADLSVPFLGRAALIAKRATGRLKDLADLEALGEGPA
jgi:hypothetical protein